MAKQKKQKPPIFDWDTAPDETSGFTEVQLPGFPLYLLNFLKVQYDPERRVLWWIDIAKPCDEKIGRHEKVIMDFACDIPAAQRTAEVTFFSAVESASFRCCDPKMIGHLRSLRPVGRKVIVIAGPTAASSRCFSGGSIEYARSRSSCILQAAFLACSASCVA
ncbi:hypothetical protein D3C80_439010 [compost metagenome]